VFDLAVVYTTLATSGRHALSNDRKGRLVNDWLRWLVVKPLTFLARFGQVLFVAFDWICRRTEGRARAR
jgi:hypothetical protein